MTNPQIEYMNKLVANEPNQIPQERIDELLEYSSVRLSMDGNCGCALLGENLQVGEAEFHELGDAEKGQTERWAIARAFNKLKARCGGQSLSYHYDREY